MSKREYSYSEIFFSIQGEGHYSGIPTVWIRSLGPNKETPVEISQRLRKLLPDGSFKHSVSSQNIHMAFTGKEPLLEQSMIIDVMKQYELEKDYPRFVTIETKGTQLLRPDFIQYFSKDTCIELFFSISPKLHVSKAKWEDAIKPAVVEGYRKLSKTGQVKYTVNNTKQAWNKVSRATDLYRGHGVDFPVFIMPTGKTKEDQDCLRKIAEECSRRGYNFAPRIEYPIYKNKIGI